MSQNVALPLALTQCKHSECSQSYYQHYIKSPNQQMGRQLTVAGHACSLSACLLLTSPDSAFTAQTTSHLEYSINN